MTNKELMFKLDDLQREENERYYWLDDSYDDFDKYETPMYELSGSLVRHYGVAEMLADGIIRSIKGMARG